MDAVTRTFLARARTDGEDRLIEADELIAGLQRQCGGNLPGALAIPALLQRVRRARLTTARLSGAIEAFGDNETVRAWVEIFPHTDAAGGCSIGVIDWQATPVARESDARVAARRLEIERNVAELTARLDPGQAVLAVESSAPDLANLAARMAGGRGRAWTDFVELPGAVHAQPMHWRLLDGASVKVEGSRREWTATLVPLGSPEPGQSGFELYLVADAPLANASSPLVPTARAARSGRPIGQDLSPVLRQPIARIIANAETIRTRLAGPLAEEYSNYAADIASAGQHLLALIEDLSDLEVVESDDFATAPDEIDLGDVSRRAVGILAVRAKERGIEIVAPAPGEALPAIAEFRRVLQILLNLVGNAIRYSPGDSTVRIELSDEGGRARVIVSDEGPGLEVKDQERVFQKFERLGRSGDGGSGLGLYISRRLARAMGGELSVTSTPGVGARFELDLPPNTKS